MRKCRNRHIVCACILAAVLCLIGGCLLFAKFKCSRDASSNQITTELFAMDTYITMTAYGRDAETALSDAEDKLIELEQLWSVTDPDSDIYAVNHSDGQPVSVSEETAELLSFALQMAEETNGALEPTIYPVLTAWGFTTEENRVPSDAEITELLKNVGYERIRQEDTTVQLESGMMLDLGGNIQAVGTKPDGSPWRLGLRDPFSGGTLGVLEISNQAVVTSGAYERYFIGEDGKQYGHIIAPTTGHPAESGLASATVIADEGRLCDALSTSLYVMGMERAIEYWQQHQNFEMILITENGEIYLTDGVADSFVLDSYHSNMTVHVIQDEEI